jgi:peptide deformylase
VTDFGPGLERLVTDLMDTCRLPGRAGLAAPQIGVDLRVFSYNVEDDEGYLINPRLVSSEGHQDGPEGCLSIPGLYAPTPRAEHAVVTGVDLAGSPSRSRAPGCWPAACSTRSIISTGTSSSTGFPPASGARRCGPSASG